MDKVRKALIIIAIYAALGVVLALFIVHYYEDLGRKEAIEKQEKVIATVTSIDPHIRDGLYDTVYDVIYEYTAEDGTHYFGIIVLLTNDLSYAQSFIGNEVEILIDGKGNCLRVSEVEYFNVDYYRNCCNIMGAIIVAYTAIWITLIIREYLFNKKNHNRKREAITQLVFVLNQLAEQKENSF